MNSRPSPRTVFNIRFGVAALVVVAVAGLVGGSFGTVPRSRVTYLATLATVQASIVAIAVSVSLLSIQFTAAEYAPQLATLFARDRPFQWTVGWFGLSIGVDLWLIYVNTSLPDRFAVGMIWAATALALVGGGVIYAYVLDLITRTTPQGIVDSSFDTLTTSEFIADAVAADIEDGCPHPLQGIVDLVVRNLDDGDSVIAQRGINRYGEFVDDTIQQLTTNGDSTPMMTSSQLSDQCSPTTSRLSSLERLPLTTISSQPGLSSGRSGWANDRMSGGRASGTWLSPTSSENRITRLRMKSRFSRRSSPSRNAGRRGE